MAIIQWVLEAKQCFWLYEQPSTSLLFEHPRLQQFLCARPAFKAFTWMGAFGADSPKGTFLWSPRPAAVDFQRNLPRRVWAANMVNKKVLADGRTSVSGGCDLKRSQAYTKEFGMSCVAIWLKDPVLPPPKLEAAKIPDIWGSLTKKDSWEDAKASEVLQYLSSL